MCSKKQQNSPKTVDYIKHVLAKTKKMDYNIIFAILSLLMTVIAIIQTWYISRQETVIKDFGKLLSTTEKSLNLNTKTQEIANRNAELKRTGDVYRLYASVQILSSLGFGINESYVPTKEKMKENMENSKEILQEQFDNPFLIQNFEKLTIWQSTLELNNSYLIQFELYESKGIDDFKKEYKAFEEQIIHCLESVDEYCLAEIRRHQKNNSFE